jgi:uracil-DNA glycosylase
MTTDQPNAKHNDAVSAAEIVRFYRAAGVEGLISDEPINRLAEGQTAAGNAQPAGIETVGKAAVEGNLFAAVSTSSAKTLGSKAEEGTPPPLEAINQAKSLEELHAILKAWDGCALKHTATQEVFSDGVPGSRLMIVGEAPGREEDLQGKPFVGRSGQLLDRMLGAIGLDRTSVYIANTIYWRPPGNRTPTTQEIAQCQPFIRKQIELAKPEILVFAGGVSAKAMLETSQGILQLRGNWTTLPINGLGSLPALPTLHPAYLLRNPPHKRLAWADWLSVKLKLESQHQGA